MPFLLPEIRCWEEIWPEFTCLRVSENHFGNPETSKIQTNNIKARPDTCVAAVSCCQQRQLRLKLSWRRDFAISEDFRGLARKILFS